MMIDVALYCIVGGVAGYLFASFFPGMPLSIKVVFAFLGTVIGGGIRKLKEEQEKSEKKKKDVNVLYNEWCQKLNRCYNSITEEIYCNCNRESLSGFYNHIWELEKQKKGAKERPYEQTFLKMWTDHVNQLRNIIDSNIKEPGYYCLSMVYRSMLCLRNAYKGDSRFDSAANALEELLDKAQKRVYYIKFLQYGDCLINKGDSQLDSNLESRIKELIEKINNLRINARGNFGEYYENISPELSNIIDYAAELMWCVACKKPFDQDLFNKAALIFDKYTARCVVNGYCTTWNYENEVYNSNDDEDLKCLLNINVEHLLALIYAKNSVGGANTVSKEKGRITEWLNEIVELGFEEEGFLLASGLAWMGLYDLEKSVLRYLFDKKVKFDVEHQDRLSFLENGGNTNIKIFDVKEMEGFLFDSSAESWNRDAYDMFFRKLEMTHKSLEYSLMISKWTKTLPLASGQEISQSQVEEAFENLVKDFDNEIELKREPAKAVNLANVEYQSPFIFHFTSERNRCVTMLFSSEKFGRNLNISILTMFTPDKELNNEQMKKYALAIKENIYVESFRESICQVVDQLIKEKVTIYDEEVPRKIFS